MIKFVEKRKIAYSVLAGILALGVICLIIFGGFNLDIQFQGGTEIKYQMKDANFNVDNAKALLSKTLNKNVNVQSSKTYDKNTQELNYMVVRIASEQTLNQEEQKMVHEALIEAGYFSAEEMKYDIQNIQPSIGYEILTKGLTAVVLALLLMIIYIAWRFNSISGWSAGVIASIAIICDGLVIAAAYAIFRFPLNESFIAAVLTVIGYSINDKIVIFDRVRENSKGRRKISYTELVDTSIQQSLKRTINTSVTTLLSVGTVFVVSVIYNIETVSKFAFPLLIGVIFGCLSSIFIAAPAFGAYKDAQVESRRK